jgi:predicted P-loop ATPase
MSDTFQALPNPEIKSHNNNTQESSILDGNVQPIESDSKDRNVARRRTKRDTSKDTRGNIKEAPVYSVIEDCAKKNIDNVPVTVEANKNNKDDLSELAILKLESRKIPSDIQEKLGLRWISKKEAQSDFYNFRGVSPWGCILIPYTLAPNLDKFYGQCLNFYPDKETENKERAAIELKAKHDKKSKFRKYLSPLGLKREDFPFYDPYKLLNPSETDKSIFMLTEDTFGVIRAALLGCRCLSSRFGVNLISKSEIDDKKSVPIVKQFLGELKKPIPWFPDNDWVNNPNVWTETIKSASYLNLDIGLFELGSEKIGLDEYIDEGFDPIALKDSVCDLEQFLQFHLENCNFKVKKSGSGIQALLNYFKIKFDQLSVRFPHINKIVTDAYHNIDSQLAMETVLNKIFENKIRLNALEMCIEFEGYPKADIECLTSWLSEEFGITFGSNTSLTKIESHLLYIAKKNVYHPFEEYLDRCSEKYKDVSISDLGNLASKYLGCTDPLHEKILLKTFYLALISRTYNPGCFLKSIPVLSGRQSAGKTSFFRACLPNSAWCVSDMSDLESKDAKMLCGKSVVMEWGEVSRITNAYRLESAKNWLTQREDHYRPPFGRRVAAHPRRFVVVGTTNDEEILTDKYDHTRFKVLTIPLDWRIPLGLVAEERDHVWGALVNYWKSLGVDEQEESLRFTDVEEQASLLAAQDQVNTDLYETEVLNFCKDKDRVTLSEIQARLVLQGNDDAIKKRLVRILKGAGWIAKRGAKGVRYYEKLHPTS